MPGNWNSGRRPQPTALKMLRGNPGKRRLPASDPAPAPVSVSSLGPVPPWLLDGLATPGRRLVRAYWREFSGWTPPKRVLLREAGLLVDWIEQHRGDDGERQAQRLLVQILNAVKE